MCGDEEDEIRSVKYARGLGTVKQTESSQEANAGNGKPQPAIVPRTVPPGWTYQANIAL